MAELAVIGANHRTAPVEVREQLALSAEGVRQVLAEMHAEKVFDETLVLSTCNRTEVYFVPHTDRDPVSYVLDHIGRAKQTPAAADRSVFYRHDDADAVRHALRVAASLDSQLVGEHEILGQVKSAYRLAVEARTAGFLLNKLLHAAFRVGKRVRTETDLGRGSAGVASAAVELARQIFTGLAGKTVLLVGAGQTAEAAARTLLHAGADHLIVANRTLYRAQQLAHDLAGASAEAPSDDDAVTCPEVVAQATEDLDAAEPVPQAAVHRAATEAVALDDLPAAVARADLVISSTGAQEPVLTWAALAEPLRRRDGPILVIDIAVPRDVEPRLGDLENVYLSNIDDLDRLVEQNLARRREEVPRAEAIVEFEAGRLERWLASRQVAPTIRLLQQHLAAIREGQIARYGKQFAEADGPQLDQFTQALCNQILHKPMAMLKGLSANGSASERAATVDLVRRLFDLDALDDEQP